MLQRRRAPSTGRPGPGGGDAAAAFLGWLKYGGIIGNPSSTNWRDESGSSVSWLTMTLPTGGHGATEVFLREGLFWALSHTHFSASLAVMSSPGVDLQRLF